MTTTIHNCSYGANLEHLTPLSGKGIKLLNQGGSSDITDRVRRIASEHLGYQGSERFEMTLTKMQVEFSFGGKTRTLERQPDGKWKLISEVGNETVLDDSTTAAIDRDITETLAKIRHVSRQHFSLDDDSEPPSAAASLGATHTSLPAANHSLVSDTDRRLGALETKVDQLLLHSLPSTNDEGSEKIVAQLEANRKDAHQQLKKIKKEIRELGEILKSTLPQEGLRERLEEKERINQTLKAHVEQLDQSSRRLYDDFDARVREIRSLTAELEHARAEISKFKEALKTQETELHQKNSENGELSSKLQQVEREMSSLQEQLEQSRSNAAAITRQLAAANEHATALERELAQSKKDVAASKDQLRQNEQQLSKLKEQLAAARCDRGEQERQIAQKVESLSRLQALLEESQSEKGRAVQELQQARVEISHLQRLVDEAKAHASETQDKDKVIQQLTRQVEESKQQIAQLEKDLQAKGFEIERLQSQTVQLEGASLQAAAVSNKQIAALSAQLEAQKSHLKTLQSKTEELQALRQELEAAQSRSAILSSSLESQTASLSRTQEEIAKQQTLITELQEKDERQKANIKTLEEHNIQLIAQLDSASSEIEILRKEIAFLTQRMEREGKTISDQLARTNETKLQAIALVQKLRGGQK